MAWQSQWKKEERRWYEMAGSSVDSVWPVGRVLPDGLCANEKASVRAIVKVVCFCMFAPPMVSTSHVTACSAHGAYVARLFYSEPAEGEVAASHLLIFPHVTATSPACRHGGEMYRVSRLEPESNEAGGWRSWWQDGFMAWRGSPEGVAAVKVVRSQPRRSLEAPRRLAPGRAEGRRRWRGGEGREEGRR